MKISYPITETARTYLGVPFKHMGRTRAGVDCAGLVVCVCNDLGIPVHDIPRYGRQPLGGLLEATVRKSFIRTETVGDGTILVMKFATEPQHLAICAGDTIIHAYERVNKCVEHRLDSVWRKRIVSAYRVPQWHN